MSFPRFAAGMDSSTPSHLTKPQRRRAMRLAYWNGGLWAVGNGMVGTSLITYLAQALGAVGLAIGLILAAPRLVGVLRIFTPRLMAMVGNRQKFCVRMYYASCAVLLALPIITAPGVVFKRQWQGLGALIVCWSLYHLLEYCGTVALTSWLGDICLQRVRGQFFGRRERWLTLGRIVGMIAAGAFTFWWSTHSVPSARWGGYGIAAGVGALVMFVSIWPLLLMPNLPVRKSESNRNSKQPNPSSAAVEGSTFRHNLSRLAEPRFLRLLLFGIFFSLVNGLSQSAQGIFPYRVLQLELAAILALEALMRLGQGMVSPQLGKLIDRFGNRPVMIVCQTIVALGLLFYLPATKEFPWWIAGAWLCWIAYAGINIALSSLTIKLAGKEDASLYLATWFGVSGVVYGLSTIVGGIFFDALESWHRELTLPGGGVLVLDRYQLFFQIGVLGRLLVALLLTQLLEPGASSVRELLAGKRREKEKSS